MSDKKLPNSQFPYLREIIKGLETKRGLKWVTVYKPQNIGPTIGKIPWLDDYVDVDELLRMKKIESNDE